jgi:hypothetical protein
MLEEAPDVSLAERLLHFAGELNSIVMLDSDILIAKRSLLAAVERSEHEPRNRVEVHLCNVIASLLQAMLTRGAL